MKKRRSRGHNHRVLPYILIVITIIVVLSLVAGYLFLGKTGNLSRFSTTTTMIAVHPIILYINQGNGAVNESNFGSMISFAKSNGFNTIFFQVYRSGVLLFTNSQLSYFVSEAHSSNFSIFFALYFTNSSETIPSSIYSLGENGINLDMSTLDLVTQSALLSSLQTNFRGQSAVTTLDFQTTLKPDLLIFETYSPSDSQYIHAGIIASVGVFATTSEQDYNTQFSYALTHSDGVMVFDYATLLARGY
ncbi:MAG TPA: hypothetical protein VJN71_09860 [Nitrososphaerales archaeon]|nr:hypothetical protein [Nitrososphaerales archaeon]